MTIEELENKHFESGYHTEVSIQFTIEILKSIQHSFVELDNRIYIENKIQELKQYLDERNTN